MSGTFTAWNAWWASPYYDLLYGARQDGSEFIRKLVQYLHPPAEARILDVGYGRGSHPESFGETGSEVTGIAVTAPLLESWKGKGEQERLQVYLHDLRLPFWVRYFDYGISLFDTFGCFDSDRENSNVLKTICHSLKKGGLLCLDYMNGAYEHRHPVPREDRMIGGVEFRIRRTYEAGYFVNHIDVLDVVRLVELSCQERRRDYRREDFERMLSREGMRIEQVFGDYHFNAWDEHVSPRLILVARRMS